MIKLKASARRLIISLKNLSKREKILIFILIAIIIISIVYCFGGQSSPVGQSPAESVRKKSTPTSTTAVASTPVDISEFGLDIAKINVWAPIAANIDEGNEAEYLGALEKGTALSKTFAKNPTEKGSMFIFGHSRYYKNKPGDYKEIFKDLNRLSSGDKFTVFYQKKAYTYEVTDSKEVAKDDFSIRDATPNDSNDKTLTLMTCWPPGTTEYRWIIFAKQI